MGETGSQTQSKQAVLVRATCGAYPMLIQCSCRFYAAGHSDTD